MIDLSLEIASGNNKASVPWGFFQGHEDIYVEDEFIPDGFTFKEPSKLSKPEAYLRLKFWYDRQQDRKIEMVFQFRAVKGKQGTVPKSGKSSGAKGKSQHRSPSGAKGKSRLRSPSRGKGKSWLRSPLVSDSSTDSDSSEETDGDGGVEDKGSTSGGQNIDLDNDADGDDNDSDAREEAEGNSSESEDSSRPAPIDKPNRGKKWLPLPFSAVPGQYTPGVKPRYMPATGPQYDRPNTRRRAGEETNANGSPERRKANKVVQQRGGPSKKAKTAHEVTKRGPPRGVAKTAAKGKK
jgi:hypothetical protein